MSSQAQAPSFGSAADRTIYAPPDSAAVLGVGYNSITNSLKDTAFLKTDPQTIGGGQNVTYELTQITSSSQLKRSLEVDAAASFSGTLNSVNARAQFANQSSVNRYSAYLVVRVSVINATVRLSSYSLTDEVTAAFDAYDTSTFQRNFLGKYGDMFVKAITTGGELIGIVQFATNTDEEVTQISAHLVSCLK